MKAVMAGNAAMGLWVRAGSWSSQQLSDGLIPSAIVTALGGTWDDSASLVNAGLWHTDPDGFRFHDWAEYQPTREEVLAERAAATARKQASRAKSRGLSHRDDHSDTQRDGQRPDGGSHSPPSRPVPSRPDPTQDTPIVSQSSHVSNRARDEDTTIDSPMVQGLNALGVNVLRVQAAILERCDRHVTAAQAALIALDRLDRASGEIKKPQAYVLGTITKSWAEIQKHIDETT